ncbi:zinc finger protein GAI-ASSOCIATED FACTOR 1 [Ricinus communis]|uniref:Nucleic acid binding protein, putative n=1 Tax=Ricinus communis TaxID=3988 RepID=B9R7R3_RICCO|nr:zinc finger protein GAI-ASSOCIATED FACTOR 1 [Ricinus communis]EEF52543.1 nucleic acid binding protein, putative [Ricinus communis]|eukprot:XP_002510356.1 protein indeterminate-domain 2 [Ricinus communis]
MEADNSSQMTLSTNSGGEGTSVVSSFSNQAVPLSLPPPKKKRNLPGMPDPDAEVIALSPKTLLATNRFVCEICNKGFQRDQNLQLHRRGHNLPWKLKQRTSKEPIKRVYVCPEASCVHHNPARALGDLTGIKKHFCRKHGEKKWKCERCSKKYAVQSDWKAHMKTCGTREYKCDCGTLFSRRDSFITHRAFCDALAEESARAQTLTFMDKEGSNNTNMKSVVAVASPPPPPLTPSTTVVSPGVSAQSSELAENAVNISAATACLTAPDTSTNSTSTTTSNVFASVFASSTAAAISQEGPSSSPSFSNLLSAFTHSDCAATMSTPRAVEPPSLSLSSSLYLSSNASSLFPDQDQHRHYTQSSLPAMSATALLQKAAQMGASSSNASFLRGLGLPVTSSTGQHNSGNQWDVKPDTSALAAAGLGLGVPSGDIMMGSSALFGNKPTTLDLLGLGMGASSALLNSYGGSFNVGAAAASASPYGGGGGGSSEETWDGAAEKKPNGYN